MAGTTRGRLVRINEVVLDQADFFQSDGFTRVTGLTTLNVTGALFFENMPQPWTYVSGVGVTPTQVAAGKVYFNEIPGSSGYYAVMFMPNAIGYWRLILTYTAGQQILGQDYDVTETGLQDGNTVVTSFVKPGGNAGGC